MFCAKALCSQSLTTLVTRDSDGPTRKSGWGRPFSTFLLDVFLGTFLRTFDRSAAARSGRDPRRLFDDRKAYAGLVTVLFRDHAPGVLGFLAGLERTLHLGRAFHELVEVHRTELASNHPEIAACGHDHLLLLTGCYPSRLKCRDQSGIGPDPRLINSR